MDRRPSPILSPTPTSRQWKGPVMLSCRRGFKLIELLVVILVTGCLLALVPSMLRTGHNDGRRVQCSHNMRQLGIALVNFSNTSNHFPSAGTFRDDPEVHQDDPSKSTIYWSIVGDSSDSDIAKLWLHN